MTRRTFRAEFKRAAVQLVLDQNYTVVVAVKNMDVGKSTMDKLVRRSSQRERAPMTPEQTEIRELKKKLSRLEEHKEILKKG